MPIDNEDIDQDDFDEYRERTRWAVLVDPDGGGWMISRVHPASEVGEYDIGPDGEHHQFQIGAFFDPNVEDILQAIMRIGGNSMESNSLIEDLLAGTCRSFVEAMANHKKWQAKT